MELNRSGKKLFVKSPACFLRFAFPLRCSFRALSFSHTNIRFFLAYDVYAPLSYLRGSSRLNLPIRVPAPRGAAIIYTKGFGCWTLTLRQNEYQESGDAPRCSSCCSTPRCSSYHRTHHRSSHCSRYRRAEARPQPKQTDALPPIAIFVAGLILIMQWGVRSPLQPP